MNAELEKKGVSDKIKSKEGGIYTFSGASVTCCQRRGESGDQQSTATATVPPFISTQATARLSHGFHSRRAIRLHQPNPNT